MTCGWSRTAAAVTPGTCSVPSGLTCQILVAGGRESEVGLVHNEMRFEWYKGDSITRWAPHARILLPIFDTCWGNDVRARERLSCESCMALLTRCCWY